MKRDILKLTNISCSSCVNKIESLLAKEQGIIKPVVNFALKKLEVEYDENIISLNKIKEKLLSAGYDSEIPETNKKTYKVSGLKCASCVKRVEDTLKKLDYILEASLDLNTSKLYVLWKDKDNIDSDLKKIIHNLGYELIIEKQSPENKIDIETEYKNKVIISAVLSGIILILTFLVPDNIIRNIILLILTGIVLFYFGIEFIKGVISFIKTFSADMNTLIGVGTLSAYIYSAAAIVFKDFFISTLGNSSLYFDTVAVIITLVLLGRYLEHKSRSKTNAAIEKLIKLQPDKVIRIENGKEVEIKITDVKINDILVVKPGQRVPIDSIIIEGSTSVDESMLTGESRPVSKNINDKVIGGTMNLNGYIKVKVEKDIKDTVLANIIKLVEGALSNKPKIQKMVDRIASYFVPVVFLTGIISFILWIIIGHNFTLGLISFVTVLIIACPCALGLATPVAIVVGVGKGAQIGILMKDALAFEKIGKADYILFDKTGTLTTGKFKLKKIQILDESLPEKEILQITASMEKFSEHSIASAVLKKAEENNISLLEINDFEAIKGKGIKALIEGKLYLIGNERLLKENNLEVDKKIIDKRYINDTVFYLFDDKQIKAVFYAGDEIKSDAYKTIDELKKLGLKIIMITGDNEEAAEKVSKELKIEKYYAGVLPEKKIGYVKKTQNEGGRVIFVGDGINDAPALVQADVGIAIGTGTDIAIESADVILSSSKLEKIVHTISLSRNVLKIIKQNLFWAFFYNALGIPIAAGILYPFFHILLSPMIAAFAMSFSSVSVLLNSLRIQRGRF